MSLNLHSIKPFHGSKKSKKRVGRGLGSTGTTAGRGQKGQKSRAGASGFQKRGMRKLILSMPKLRGFNSPNAKKAVVNLTDLAALEGVVTPKTLKEAGLIATTKNGVKILGDGEISKALTVKGCAVSKSAAEKITAAGGEIKA